MSSLARASGRPSVSRGSSTSSPWWCGPLSCMNSSFRLVLGDLLSDELGVVLDEADQRGAARVLPGEAEKVEAANVGDAATVAWATKVVEDRKGSRSSRA